MLLKPETDQKIYKTRMQDCASVQNWSIYNHLQLGLDRASVVEVSHLALFLPLRQFYYSISGQIRE